MTDFWRSRLNTDFFKKIIRRILCPRKIHNQLINYKNIFKKYVLLLCDDQPIQNYSILAIT